MRSNKTRHHRHRLRCLGAALGVMVATYGAAQAAAPASAKGNWSEFGFLPSGGRFNPHENILNTTNVSALKVLWSVQDGSFPFTAPAVVNGVVYSGTNAFDAATGTLLWATNSGGLSPAVSKSTVYIDSFFGLCAYAAAGGTNLWCAGTNYLPDAPSAAVVVDGIAYFGSAVGSIFAINAATGEQLWSAPISANNAASSPAVANGVVYINGDDLLAFDAKTGAKLWSSSILGGVNTSSPAVVGGVVYAGGRVVAAFNAETGAVLWSASPGGPDGDSAAASTSDGAGNVTVSKSTSSSWSATVIIGSRFSVPFRALAIRSSTARIKIFSRRHYNAAVRFRRRSVRAQCTPRSRLWLVA